MSALTGTNSPKPSVLRVRSLRLFEMVGKGHVWHVGVNERPGYAGALCLGDTLGRTPAFGFV